VTIQKDNMTEELIQRESARILLSCRVAPPDGDELALIRFIKWVRKQAIRNLARVKTKEELKRGRSV